MLLMMAVIITSCGDDDDDDNDDNDVDPGPCTDCATIIFEDDFNRANTTDGDLGTDWALISADEISISILDQKIVVGQDIEEAQAGFAVVNNMNINETDFTISLDARLPVNSDMTIGVIGRVDPEQGEGYGLLVENQQLKLFRFENEDAVELMETTFSFSSSITYTLELKFEGTLITGTVYDTSGNVILVVSGNDATYAGGNFGFVAKSGESGATVEIDNFSVEK